MSTPILIEIPAEYKALADSIGSLVAAVTTRCRSTAGGEALDYLSIEDELREHARDVERGAHEAVLTSTMVDAQSIEIDGKELKQVCRSRGHYKTQAGVVTFERPLYRERGVRNGPTFDPIAVRIGATKNGWLPGTAKIMAYLMQLGTSREAAEVARQTGRTPYSRTSFERVSHVVGEIFIGYREEIEEELITEFVVPDAARSVSVSIDRVSIPMEEPRPRPRGRPAKNAPKNPIARNYRMAYCATATLHDKSGDGIHAIRYGRMPEGDEIALAESLGSDVMALLKQRPDLDVVRLADGAPEMWNLLESHVDDKSLGKDCISLVDFWHFVEKLSAAAKELYGADSNETFERWRSKLLNNLRGASTILRELREAAPPRRPKGEQDPVHEAISYIVNHRKRMNYADAKKRGLPIGSGSVEATCKSLVQMRMKRAGSRWKETTGDHIMQLRAMALSGRWDPAMGKLFRRRQRAVRLLAA